MKQDKLVEIARSFGYKLNAGNYETRDFFCSQKAEVPESEAEKTSEALYQFCKAEVIKSVNEYKAEIAAKPLTPKEPEAPKKEEIDITDKLKNIPNWQKANKQWNKSQAEQEISEGLARDESLPLIEEE